MGKTMIIHECVSIFELNVTTLHFHWSDVTSRHGIAKMPVPSRNEERLDYLRLWNIAKGL